MRSSNDVEAIAKGEWPNGPEDPGWRGGYRRYASSKLFLAMMISSLQARLNEDPALSKICVLGVDPGIMSTGLQRRSGFVIRIILFRIVYPLMTWWNPLGSYRTTDRSASEILKAALQYGSRLEENAKEAYFDGTLPKEMGVESRDAEKRDWVWKASIRLAGLKEGDTALERWQ